MILYIENPKLESLWIKPLFPIYFSILATSFITATKKIKYLEINLIKMRRAST